MKVSAPNLKEILAIVSLSIGAEVVAETLDWRLTIKKKLGEGGQGVAYLASGPGGDLVVKWYNAEQATDVQRQAIRQLVKDGPPTGLAGKRFVWPLDVVTAPQSQQFGYLMSVIDTQRFAELGEVWSRSQARSTLRPRAGSPARAAAWRGPRRSPSAPCARNHSTHSTAISVSRNNTNS